MTITIPPPLLYLLPLIIYIILALTTDLWRTGQPTRPVGQMLVCAYTVWLAYHLFWE